MPKRSERDRKSSDNQILTVVGIGASAGGLVALQGFFDEFPADSGMAFVVVTHMDPERESLLPELIQAHTNMPVHQVQAEIPVEANHIYVISPNRRIVITDKHLDVEEFSEPRGQRKPIDYFFRSLANVHRNAIAIILSGGGTDGAVGVKDIKEQGGLILVQHPDEAEHDGMPRAALSTGLADIVLPVRQLAERLVDFRRNYLTVPIDLDNLTQRDLDAIQDILAEVLARTGHDFSQYKRSTLLRRIERRLHLTNHTSFNAYLLHLRHTPDEARALFNDLLIGVTNFFRDAEAWQALAQNVIPRLFEDRRAGQTIRAWTIGCSTGEEAYTLAMLLVEHAAKMSNVNSVENVFAQRKFELQIFASDLDDSALEKAREGLYPAAIEADVSAERLNRFFTAEGQYYRIRCELRDLVLFTNHSVLRDPPFSRIDLISCRNLLIYLNRDLQRNVLDIFHYALNPAGYLFLGNAESAEMVNSLFQTLDKSNRIYQAKPWRSDRPHIPVLPLHMHTRPEHSNAIFSGQPPADKRHIATKLHWEALEAFAPPSVLIDDEYKILHVSETAGRYLQIRRGSLSNDLLELIRPEMQFELRAALLQAFRLKKAVVTPAISVQFDGNMHHVILAVRLWQRKEHRTDFPIKQTLESSSSDIEGENPEAEPLTGVEQLALVMFLEHETVYPERPSHHLRLYRNRTRVNR